MKFPKAVKIGKHKFNIARAYHSREPFIGRLNLRNFDILINRNYPETVQQEAIVHELLHGCSIIYGLCLTEQQVTTLAEAVYSNLLGMFEKA